MKQYTNTAKTLTVGFDVSKCTHCKNCLDELPEVFQLGHKPWMKMDGAEPSRIREVVGNCPSGALTVIQ